MVFSGKNMRPAINAVYESGKKSLVGAEIGVFRGKHAQFMLDKLDIKKLYLVDQYKMYMEPRDSSNGIVQEIYTTETAEKWAKEAYRRLMISDNIGRLVWLTLSSLEASRMIPDKSLDFVYIDANHEYEFIRADIRAWLPKVKSGGVFGGHDFGVPFVPGVEKAVRETFGDEFHKRNQDWWIFKE
jgi:hypothetical protein